MRYTVFLIILTFSTSLRAQKITEKDIVKAQEVYAEYKIPNKDNIPFYEFIDSTVSGHSKAEIHKAAVATLADFFNDSKAVIEVNDIEQGLIIGRGRSRIKFNWSLVMQDLSIPYNLEIRCRDGKYRVQLKNIDSYEGVSQTVAVGSSTPIIHAASRFPKDFTKKFWTVFSSEMNAFEPAFKAAMAKRLKAKDEF